MRVVVAGAGGVGALLGGMLARAGEEVGFLARGESLRALAEKGLVVDSPRGTFHLARVFASDDPEKLRGAEVVLVAVKSWQVRDLAPRLAPLLAPEGFAVPLENGVEAAEILASALGRPRVVGGLCHLISFLEAPGRVKHTGERLEVTLGELGGGASPRIEALAGVMRKAGVDVVVSDDVESALWKKFAFIAPFGGVGAVTRAPAGVMRSIPETRSLLRSAIEEVLAVAAARGVRLPPQTTASVLNMIDSLGPDATASMQRDIIAGRPSELDDQIGAVVRLGRSAGVRVPSHAFLLAALVPQEREARAKAR
ncbi:MAG TPA: 2-dehydropantoate 2-reductase [Anaeromyxobacteraceae bacterium]|nr:2-dehydropantoate 2-reductase [Anaeromyxobacteraceae bacterium]